MLYRAILLLLAGSLVAGCSASAELDPQAGRSADQTADTQLAAYAAANEFPDADAADDLRAAAVVKRENQSVKIYNFSNDALRDVDVWVNGSYVRKVSSIPANGSVTVPLNTFYDASGRSLAQQKPTINTVQLADDDRLFNLQGPVQE